MMSQPSFVKNHELLQATGGINTKARRQMACNLRRGGYTQSSKWCPSGPNPPHKPPGHAPPLPPGNLGTGSCTRLHGEGGARLVVPLLIRAKKKKRFAAKPKILVPCNVRHLAKESASQGLRHRLRQAVSHHVPSEVGD